MTYFDFELTHCPVELSLDIINRKWVLQIICDMFFGKTRFSEFQKERPEMSNKALSRSLKFMEEQGLIKKDADEYFLTPKTLDNNEELYDEKTILKAKEGFRKQLLE